MLIIRNGSIYIESSPNDRSIKHLRESKIKKNARSNRRAKPPPNRPFSIRSSLIVYIVLYCILVSYSLFRHDLTPMTSIPIFETDRPTAIIIFRII